jgi:Nif-specific regulatory protein
MPFKGPIKSEHIAYSGDIIKAIVIEVFLSLKGAMSRFEKDLLIDALKSSHGNMRIAAKTLETTERIFGYKIKKYYINPKQYR